MLNTQANADRSIPNTYGVFNMRGYCFYGVCVCVCVCVSEHIYKNARNHEL